MPFFTEQQQETATAGARDLAAQSAVLTRQSIHLIDQRIGNLGRDPLFGFPALVQQGPKRPQVGLQQRAPHVIGKFPDFVKRFDGRTCLFPSGLFLFMKKTPGVMGHPGKK